MFLERNDPPLNSLELGKLDCTVLDFIGCLASLSVASPSTLTHLTLSRCLLDDECIQKLWGDENSIKVQNAIRTLMCIKSLGLEYCHIYGLNDLINSLCVDHLLWPGARAVASFDHLPGLRSSLEELFVHHCGTLSEESQENLDASPILVEFEEGDPRERPGDEEED